MLIFFFNGKFKELRLSNLVSYNYVVFKVIGCLKQKIEAVINEFTAPQLKIIVEDCETILLDRENRLVNVRKYALQALSMTSSDGKSYYSSSERGLLYLYKIFHDLFNYPTI